MADSVAEVRDLEDRRWAAVTTSNLDVLGELYSPDMAYTHSNAMFDSRDSYFAPIRDGAVTYTGVRRTDEEVRIHGDTAVVTGRADIDVTAGGKVLNPVMRYSAIWARINGAWSFVCWHSTAVPK